MPYFHFSIGPVQEFVNQARRTNDFWGGSFLLSWLAGVAMLCAKRQGATPVYPLPPDGYLDWLAADKATPAEGNLLAKVGAIPNRFCMQVDENFAPAQVEAAVRAAWQALATHTRDCMFAGAPSAPGAQAIWQRQIGDQPGGLWEILWLMAEKEDPAAFDARKPWRSHPRQPEGAPFCSLMAGWQALPLSDAERQAAENNGYRLSRDDDNNARKEDLCAPALIKRHFAKAFSQFTDEKLGLKGWPLPPNAPSTHYLAAAPWLAALLAKATPEALAAHEKLATSLGVGTDEAQTRLRMVQNAKKNHQHLDDSCSLNAPYWFANEVANATLSSPDANPPLLASLNGLYKLLDAKPAKHYALLLMDGDHMGHMLKHAPGVVAEALKQFTTDVAVMVDQHSGFLVYAGGDDVLALLPPNTALACAVQLRSAYLTAFAKAMAAASIAPPPTMPKASISCALLYAHTKTPLTQLLDAAHHLLDDVAKRQCGRDSVAFQVWKRAGLNLTFAQKWQNLFEPAAHASLPGLLQEIAQDASQGGQAKQFSQQFFQRAHAVLQELAPLWQRSGPNEQLVDACKHLLREEYRHGLPRRQNEAAVQREQRIARLIDNLLHLAAPLRTPLPAPLLNSPLAAPQAALLPLLQFLLENISGVEGNLP